MEWNRSQLGIGGCRLDSLVNVIWEGAPRSEGHKISSRMLPLSRCGSTVGTKGTEFCISIIRKGEIREMSLHSVQVGEKEASDCGSWLSVCVWSKAGREWH